MARPKAPVASPIETKIKSKIASIQAEIEKLQLDLGHWQKVASDYETNKVTIESILSVHEAPSLSGGGAGTRGGRKGKNGGRTGNG